jgi:hypothetical protein
MRPILVLALSLSLPAAATADMGPLFPVFSRVPHDFVFEVEADSPGYRFWLMSDRGVEPLNLAPGQPFRVDGSGRERSQMYVWVVAAPVGLVEGVGEAKFAEALTRGQSPQGVRQSDYLHFYGFVPYWDSRSRVIDRYRVELSPSAVQLVWLEQNAGSVWVKRMWAVGGILCAVAALWGGWWILRRMRRFVTVTTKS